MVPLLVYTVYTSKEGIVYLEDIKVGKKKLFFLHYP